MKQLKTTGIILGRTDYGEADRILTVLTPDHGKLKLMARGVRKVKSKLAGGIELFSTSQLTYIEGRGEIGTLVSSRLDKHYGLIVRSIERVQLGYELIKLLDKATEDHPEPDYYTLLERAFTALNDAAVPAGLVRTWFQAQLLKLAGHTPNLQTDTDGHKLAQDQSYGFDFEAMAFAPRLEGPIAAAHIKTLRLCFSSHSATAIAKVQGADAALPAAAPLVRAMLSAHLRL